MMKKYFLFVGLLMLLVSACTSSANNNESEQIMNGLSTNQIVIPKLDQNVSKTFETATFALG